MNFTIRSSLFIMLLLTGCSPAATTNPKPSGSSYRTHVFRAGVSYDGRADPEAFCYLVSQGTSWLAAIPFGYGQKVPHRPPTNGYRFSRYPGESIKDIRHIITTAKEAGLEILLKPHLWFFKEDSWRGDIAMTTEADWSAFFSAYRSFLEPLLDMARQLGVEAFCVGTELSGTTDREQDWRELITWARNRYPGELTYAAHWEREASSIRFWDALDFIGIQAYYPLADSTGSSESQLVIAWEQWKPKLKQLADVHGKQIVFTEIGYRARANPAMKPWKWDFRGKVETEAQAMAYRATVQALDGAPWLGGIFIWKWPAGYAGLDADKQPPWRGRFDGGFSPQGYPAEEVIFRWFQTKTNQK